MGIGTSIFLIAVGAILAFAVEVDAEGVDLQTVGVILMIVGALGALFSLVYWNSWGGWGGSRRGRDVVVVDDAPVTTRRRRVIEEDL